MVNSTLYPGQQRKAWVVKYKADGLEEHFEEEELRSAKHGPGLISRSRVILPACRCSPSTIFPLNFLERFFLGDLYLSFRLSRSRGLAQDTVCRMPTRVPMQLLTYLQAS